MPTDAKRHEIAELTELLRSSSALAVADYRGLTVPEMQSVLAVAARRRRPVCTSPRTAC